MNPYSRGYDYSPRKRGPHHSVGGKLGIAGEWVLAIAIILTALIVLIGAFWQMEYGTQRLVTFTIQSLDDQANGSGHQYMVFTTGGQVYEDTDAWFHGKTDSSNVWAMFLADPHGTFTCPVYGYRNTLFSSYQDILDGCKKVTVPAAKADVLPNPLVPSTDTELVQRFG